MQSDNILLLGILFVALLMTFCVTTLINTINPNSQTQLLPNKHNISQDNEAYKIIKHYVKEEEKILQDSYEQNHKKIKKVNFYLKLTA